MTDVIDSIVDSKPDDWGEPDALEEESGDLDSVETEISEDLEGGEGEGEDAPEEDLAEEEELAAKPTGKGSEKNPHTIKDMPDQYVKLKIDGQEEVVNLKEYAEGVIRLETFTRRMNQLNSTAQRVSEAQKNLEEREANVRESLQRTLSNPRDLFQFLDDYGDYETVDKVVQAWAQRAIKLGKLPPQQQARFFRERDQKFLRSQAERQRAAQEAEQHRRESAEAAAQMRSYYEPAYNEGLKQAGISADMVTDEMRDVVHGLVQAVKRKKGQLERHDVTSIVVKAARAAGVQPPSKKGPTPKRTGQGRRKKASGTNKKRSWQDFEKELERKYGGPLT